jgi:hypothetical protein
LIDKIHRNLNIYEACIPDRMHHIDLSLFKYQLDFTQDILKEVREAELLKIFDDRLCQILHFSRLKLISKLDKLKIAIASDYRHLMKVVLFALDDIFDGWNGITCNEFCDLYSKFSNMYLMSRKESYTENDIKNFEVIILTIN